MTQRLLKAALAGAPSPYADGELDALAAHCTVQEDNAAKVERQVRKSAAALVLSPRVGETFDGIVTGASAKGTWVRIVRPPAEGRVMEGADGLDVGDRRPRAAGARGRRTRVHRLRRTARARPREHGPQWIAAPPASGP